MKIKDLFWKLFWLMLRGKGNARILFDSEAVCFKAHMIPIVKVSFGERPLGYEYLSLHWDSEVDQYVRIKGDIDDIQAIIKHVNDKDEFEGVNLDVKFNANKYMHELVEEIKNDSL